MVEYVGEVLGLVLALLVGVGGLVVVVEAVASLRGWLRELLA